MMLRALAATFGAFVWIAGMAALFGPYWPLAVRVALTYFGIFLGALTGERIVWLVLTAIGLAATIVTAAFYWAVTGVCAAVGLFGSLAYKLGKRAA